MFWTALNFFLDTVDDRYAISAFTVEELRKNFSIVSDAPKFGDVLVYENEKVGAFHAAVYIAGDIIFTKNGSSVTAPWLYTTLDSMAHFYPDMAPVSVRVYRHRET